MTASADEIVSFWHQAGPDRWFTKDFAFDTEIRERFFDTYEAAAAGNFSAWEKSAHGALALLILLDQFHQWHRRMGIERSPLDGLPCC